MPHPTPMLLASFIRLSPRSVLQHLSQECDLHIQNAESGASLPPYTLAISSLPPLISSVLSIASDQLENTTTIHGVVYDHHNIIVDKLETKELEDVDVLKDKRRRRCRCMKDPKRPQKIPLLQYGEPHWRRPHYHFQWHVTRVMAPLLDKIHLH